MDTEKTVNVSKGEIVFFKPKAGVRNRAALKAEEGGKFSEIKFMTVILPLCVKSHPFGTVPVSQALDSLEIEEYDACVEAIRELIAKPKGDVEKKSERPLSQTNTQKTRG